MSDCRPSKERDRSGVKCKACGGPASAWVVSWEDGMGSPGVGYTCDSCGHQWFEPDDERRAMLVDEWVEYLRGN